MYNNNNTSSSQYHNRARNNTSWWWWLISLSSVVSVFMMIYRNGPSSLSTLRSSSSSRSLQTNNHNHNNIGFEDAYYHGGVRKMKKKKLLLGIFTMADGKKEKQRRALIRETYLTEGGDRLCLWRRYQDLFDRGDYEAADRCEILYAFVAGRIDPEIPFDHFRSDRPLTVERASNPEQLVMLNVKENMARGKTYAYFKWASHELAARYDLDYVIKTDDDSLISLPKVFHKIVDKLPPWPYNRRFYGGHVTDAMECNIRRWDHCKLIVPNGYMAGQFYFMSPDLAYAVTNDDVERVPSTNIEDLDMGQAVFRWSRTNKEMINTFTFGGKVHVWTHPVKDESKWRFFWKRYQEEHVDYVW